MFSALKEIVATTGALAIAGAGLGGTSVYKDLADLIKNNAWEMTVNGQHTDSWFEFSGKKVRGSDSCNSFRGTGHVSRSEITFNNDQTSTRMACLGENYSADFHKATSGTRKVSHQGSTLVLSDVFTGESWTFEPRG